ncbi:MAG TPA: hypothetical protein VK835_10590 [Bacteroidia bacterium]|nr:hypothetical protein [Bacteroidia bacterium]
MKKIALIFLFSTLFLSFKIDFADYCEVHLNSSLVLKIYSNEFETAKLNLKNLKGTDVLKITYVTDTPSDEKFKISVKDKNGKIIKLLDAYDDLGRTPSRLQCTEIMNYDIVYMYVKNKNQEYRIFETDITK